jgi:hypothetical protein
MWDVLKLEKLTCTIEHVKLLSNISTSAPRGKVLRTDGWAYAVTVMVHSVTIKQRKCPSCNALKHMSEHEAEKVKPYAIVITCPYVRKWLYHDAAKIYNNLQGQRIFGEQLEIHDSLGNKAAIKPCA